MFKKNVILIVMIAFVCSMFITIGCAKKDHWGQELKIDEKWWKKEGHSWDRKDQIFMAIGYSNPDWKEQFDLRKSADLNARSEVASFMQSLTKNYIQELRNSSYAISESIVESSADETLLGAAIVSRHYEKGKKQYQSLIQVDLKYFFNQIYKKFEKESAARIRGKNPTISSEELDQMIHEKTEEALTKLKAMEDPVIEKTINQGNEGGAQ
ncbi:MAG: hypothetical protein COS89_00040 [Deltaproteobacteria bacterium CG07_land_8_20_14_0_80_38_7]|nr:MAG: hypothetical protein COS89_00040 [Deltaproteobacteria bacterium CG07_land_8_20_14_0_80_38_7]